VGLESYERKRDFDATPEPGPVAASSDGGNLFVVQKHAARRLHYDFRLELGGVLKSWAVPKGPSLDPAQKRLAVHVEDHPLDYAAFEGRIPEGQYGGGTVMVWDRGRWYPEEEAASDAVAAYEAGRLKFRLEGEKLRGRWMLLRLKPKPGDRAENWLLFKERDEEARAGDDAAITERRPLSVLGERSMEEIAAGVEARSDAGASSPGLNDLSAIEGARPTAAPPRPDLELATSVPVAPAGDDWLHEIKYDGYRVICRLEPGGARFLTRGGNDWTDRFTAIGDALRAAVRHTAILDGEMVYEMEGGRTSFAKLASALRAAHDDPHVVYCVFDLLYADGYDLTGVALQERKRLLRAVLDEVPSPGRIRYVDHVVGSGEEFLAQACALALEGAVSKRRDSRYRAGRGRDWQKAKCLGRQEFVVGGFTERAGGNGIGALLVGVYSEPGGGLQFAGRVGTGWDDETMAELRRRLLPLSRDATPFVDPPVGKRAAKVTWVEPEVVIEAEYLSWDGGALRHASFRGVRSDKPATDVVREGPSAAAESASTSRHVVAPSKDRSSTRVAGVAITHPERVLFPEIGLTKLDIARYYESVGSLMLPYLVGRPLTLVRCPEGRSEPCFYQRHAAAYFPPEILRVPVSAEDGGVVHGAVDSVAGIVSLVQMGVLELHVWGSRVGSLDYPDQLVFDFDPDPALPFASVVDGVRLMHDLLAGLGLRSFVKATGGKGLHVVVPVEPERTWDELKPFTRAAAEALARFAPETFTTNMSLKQRGGRIFVDYLRNRRGATSICVYSTRRKAGAPVAVALRWDELGPRMRGDRYTVKNVRRRLGQIAGNPWEGYAGLRQHITPAMERALAASIEAQSKPSAGAAT